MKEIDIRHILKSGQAKQILFDASGVMYNKANELVIGAAKTVDLIRELSVGLCLLTNNSKHSPAHIRDWFLPHGVSFETQEIISSGHGLGWETTLKTTIQNKTCFVQGASSSYPYVERAEPKAIVASLDQAEVIICTSFDSEDEANYFEIIKQHLLEHPEKPVICCNPDHYIHNEDRIAPVVGYWVNRLEAETGITAQWFGKPHSAMYHMVNDHLTTHFDRQIDSDTWFFDDNPLNIQNFIQSYPEANGVFTYKTGLRYKETLDEIRNEFPTLPYFAKTIGDLSAY